MVKVHFIPERVVLGDAGQIISLVRPHQLRPRVLLHCDGQPLRLELDPGVIFQSVYLWFGKTDGNSLIVRDQIARELQNASANQGMQSVTKDP